ncbi:MAG: YceI family protein [Prolixibacteraceae bacterium]|nr:YceI family protein [Prolixibacteraceae bacterium]
MKCSGLKFLIAIVAFISIGSAKAQELIFDHGTIEFYTSTVVSDIEAVSEKAEVKLNLATGEVTVTIDIESFEFEYELMREHFNEKYMETQKFPKSIFKGKIAQNISDGIENEMEVDVSGKLTIHGVTNEIKFLAKLSKQAEFTVVKAKIPVVFNDYGIEDPSILTKPVAKEVEIVGTLYLKQTAL